MQTSKRLLALLLCAVMLFTTVPVEAFATGEAPSDETVVTEPAVEETESTGVPSETEAEAETSAPEEVTEEPTASTEEEVTLPAGEFTEPDGEADITAEIEPQAETGAVMVVHNGETTYYDGLEAAFNGFAPSNNTYGGTYVVTLLEDVPGMTAVKNFQYPTEVLNITLDLNGHTITGNGTNIAVNINLGSNAGGVSSGTFTITDSAGGGVITGGKGGVYVYGKNATFNFQGGTITGNHGASKGGGILVGATTFFRMTGGVITGNSVTGSSSANTGLGGGVCANYATISGGAIYGNTAYAGSHVQTGRGGGVCTEITRTKGYSTLIIADGVVFGNTAGNAGDDIMAQGNGMSSAKFSLSIGTENWYIDGWNGKKASAGNGEADRYSAENPVAYTDGGFTDQYNVSIGLKYVAPTIEPEVPADPYDNGGSDTNVADFIQFVDANGHGALLMNITGGFTAGEVVWNEELGTWTCDLTFDAAALLAVYNESYAGHRYADEIGETITVTHKWFCGEGAELSTTEGKWVPNVDGNIYKVNVTCKPLYTVTYNDGVEGEEIFADQTYTVEEGEATPAFNGNPYREGYTFEGWLPEVAETVTGDATYTAQWKKIPVYVARLESTGEQFETLQAALDAAKTALTGDLDADKITMIGDTTECVKLAWSRNNGSMTLTIDLNGHTVTGNGTGSVMTFSGLTSYNGRFAIVIEDSSEAKTGTITGGNATSGGAIKLDGAKSGDSLTINGGNFTGNTASSNGGALYCAVVGATITVNGGTFTGNTAASGGAISAYSLVINGGTFVKNSATGTAQFTGRGGAIVMWGTAALSLDINGGVIYGNTASRYGDDIVFCSTNKTTASMSLINAADMGVTGVNGWYVDGYYGSYTGEALLSDRFNADNAVEFTDYADFSGTEAKGIVVALKAAAKALPAVPEIPADNGSNVTKELITIVCDTDNGHEAKTYGWGDPAANFVFPEDSQPVWNEELEAWTISVRIDSIGAYYVGLQFSKEHNGIQHEIIKGEPLTSDEYNRIDTTLVWDAENAIWQTLTGKPFEVHVTCQTAPEAPSMGYHLGKFQIKVVGVVDGEEKVWHESLHAETVTVGEVKGDRESGFTVDVTVTLAEGDSYFNAWLAKHAPDAEEGDYLYDWSKTDNTVTFTMKYTGDTTGELYDGPEYWGVEGDHVYTAYVMEGAPDAPTKFGENVTPALVRVICDSDPNHEPMDIKWQHQSTEVRTWESGVVWSEEHNAWIVPIRIDSISVYYVWLNYEKANNDIIHDLVPDMPLPEGKNYIDTYLKWDAEQDLWVTLDGNPIEIHTTCKTAPTAPAFFDIKSFQIQVYGIVDGEEKLYAIHLDPNTTTIGEVKGSREDGFTVDVTVTITEDDAYEAGWIEKRDPDSTVADREYDWSRTPETITFTLEYTGDLTGNLYGDRSGDWVRTDNGKTYGAVGQAYLITAKPAAPEQKNVVEDLVTIICDSDPERHAPVTGKWYPQHCKTTSDMVWNDELKAWTVDIRIGSLYIMYVNQLEDANNGTIHELVEDITTVYSTLVWDAEQGLWVPMEPIELHTTCRTAPIAPNYNQIDGYQIKVYGDVDDDGVYGETKPSNNGIGEVYTTSIPEGGYTLSEVYGSREEGFFVDVTVPIENGDAYITNWIANCEPGAEYLYDFEKTPTTVTFTLRYNGSLTGTLYGDRHAANTNYDWVLDTNGNHFGVVGEGYVEQKTYAVQLVIYRNGNITAPYDVVSLERLPKGDVIDLSELDIADYYSSSALGYEFEGWFNDGAWNQYKAGKEVAGLDEITVNGWTNIICMVTDYHKVVVKAVTNGDKDNAEVIFTGKALYGENLVEWLNANVEVAERTGYTLDKWYNWDWYGHKYDSLRTVSGWTNVYVTYTADTFQIVYRNWQGTNMGTYTQTATYDEALTLIANRFKRTGYTFSHWNSKRDTNDGKFTFVDQQAITAEVVNELYNYAMANEGKAYLNVYWTANEYTVTLDANGGELETSELTVTYDAPYGELPEPTKTGYNFAGWYDENGNEVTADTIYKIAHDSTLTAQWEAATFQIVYRFWLGTNMGTYTQTATYDEGMTLIPNKFTRAGYSFDHWNSKRDTDDGKFTFADQETISAEVVNELYNYAMANEGKAYLNAYWTANEYTVSYNTNGGPEVADKVVTFGGKYGIMPTSSITGLSCRKTDWYLVDENGNVTDINIRNTTVVSVARDHELFLMRDVLAPSVKIALTVPGGLSDSYKYYDGNARVLTATVSNMNAEVLDYTYQWYKDGVAIEGATGSVLTLEGNVSDSGTYKVVVTATLKDGSEIVVKVNSASGEKSLKVQIMRAANTLRLNENYGETPVTSDSYWGSAVATIRGGATREGYTFAGWNTAADGSGETYQVGDEIEFPGDNGNGGVVLELFAQWNANEYTVTFNPNGGAAIDPIKVVFDAKYGRLPSSALTGFSGGDSNWYLVDEDGNVTDTKITRFSVVSTARDHELFVVRKILNPAVKITLTVPGGLSDGYKYYDGNPRVLTATVTNANEAELVYSYQWYKDDVAIEGATEAVLTLDGNVSDSGTYKVVVTATLKDGSKVVVTNESASGEKTQKVQIMRATNTLRLNYNYGETPETHDSYFGGAVATIRGDAGERTGYTFAGWNTAADGSGTMYQAGDSVEFPGDNGNGGVVLELFAQWEGITYTIKYNGGEGSEYTGSEPNSGANWMLIKNGYTYDAPVTLDDGADFVRTGYTLVGWTIGGVTYELGQTVEKNFTKVQSGTVQAYAIWEPITYTIKYNGGEGSEYTGPIKNSGANWMLIKNGYTYDAPVTLDDGADFVRTGYTLVGWTIGGVTYELGQTVEKNFTKVQSGTVQAYAVWEGNSYTLILDANGGEFVMPLAEDSDAVTTVEIPVTYGEAIGELPTPVREGYTFAGWFDAEGNEITAETVYNTDGNLTVTAKWTPNTYEVKLDANGGELEDDTIEATYGEPIGELPTPTRDGYTFAGWVDADGNKVTADTIYDVADDITLVATWNVNKPADPSSPATGDGMTMFFMVSMLASAAALLFLADRKRRMA